MIVAGISGGMRYGAAAIAGEQLQSVCSQERVLRHRGAGVNASGLPDEALDLVLEGIGASRADIGRVVAVESETSHRIQVAHETIDHHLAHALTAYLTSAFPSAVIVVCDHEAPRVSVWSGNGDTVSPVEWPWTGPGFADVFSRIAAALGFRSDAADQRLEALARLSPDNRDAQVETLMRLKGSALDVSPALEAHLADRLAGDRETGSPTRARLAAALQAHLGDLLLEMLSAIRNRVGNPRLCVGGSLFYHSSVNTRVKMSGYFDEVFVPVDPGNGGMAVGAAQYALGSEPTEVSPFLGPVYGSEAVKAVLDNCKLQYAWESDGDAIGAAVDGLRQGLLVGWFDGPMEWGPRALGARCILANPSAPYVLENLNHFLKRREPWRGYALSGLEDSVLEDFEGPPQAPFMECDYRPREPARFANVLPSPAAAVRVHTVSETRQPRFARLLEAFRESTGMPFLVNTSFNGFHEPIVCSPRDAVRVFYGTGLDRLVLGQFVLSK